MKKTFFRALFPIMIMTAFVPLATFAFFSSILTKNLAMRISGYELAETAKIAAVSVKAQLEGGGDITQTLTGLAAGTMLRLTVIDRNGTVLFDSAVDINTLENHYSREEVRDSFEKGSGFSWRRSVSTGIETVYAGVRIDRAAQPADPLMLRAALPLPLVASEMRNMSVFSAIILAVILLLSLLLSYRLTDTLRRPVAALGRTAEQWAKGELGARASVQDPLELSRLSEIMNRMIAELKARIDVAEKTGEEIQGVFDSMTEAVIVTDASGNVISRNPKADEFFGVKGPATILGYTRNSEITALELAARKGSTEETEIKLYGKTVRCLKVVASPLPRGGGAVVVSSDITRLLRLETVRKDFVANVSHELKTPIQSIRGFAETLASGALDDRESALRFVSIIARQAERMDAIIEDLLSLARIERAEEGSGIETEIVRIEDVLATVAESAARAASEKNIVLTVAQDGTAIVRGSKGLLEQALFNLVDNAVKFSPPGSEVIISAAQAENTIRLSVKDSGPGIPPSDTERIFERFFRVEKSRSRESGGTGLGLAIVKHIALVHKGSVSVVSELGKGSEFILVLPRA